MDINELVKMIDEALEIEERPEIIGKPAARYDSVHSRHPERIRVSFSDGTTAVYELRVEQPAPQIMENVRIIRKWANGYQHQPERPRRRRNR